MYLHKILRGIFFIKYMHTYKANLFFRLEPEVIANITEDTTSTRNFDFRQNALFLLSKVELFIFPEFLILLYFLYFFHEKDY